MPKMTHPASKHAIDVAPDQVPMYESQGWRTGSPKKPAKKAAARKRASAPRNRATNQADTATTKE